MIFVDTSAWVSRALKYDQNHAIAETFFAINEDTLITTDYVIDEVLTLLQARSAGSKARKLSTKFFSQAICQIHWVTPPYVLRAWRIFNAYTDKEWSFTDCVSKAVMDDLKITRAFAFDRHFRHSAWKSFPSIDA